MQYYKIYLFDSICVIYTTNCDLRLNHLTSDFTAKNIVLAGIKVCVQSMEIYIDLIRTLLGTELPDALATVLVYMCALYVCVQAVTLHDTQLCKTWDLGSNFFIRKEDVLSQRKR